MTQEEALDILKLGSNVYLTGPAGSGKTFLLNQYIDYLKRSQKGVGITASTGIAATHIGGITIHSWSGLGIKDELRDADLRKLLRKNYLKKRFRNTGALIIDEISMLNAYQFDLINIICQAFKNNVKPFGGMQVVCSGDFFQLPPIQKKGEAKFVIESDVWKNMNLKICYLEEQYRQEKEEQLFALLNNIRNNEIEKAQELLDRSNCGEKKFFIEPAKLYTHNVDIDAVNNSELSKIQGKSFVYQMENEGNKNIAEALKKGCLAPEKLVLKIGAKVMFVKNNFEQGYINGTLGKIIGFDYNNMPIVEILGGRKIEVGPATWTVEEDELVKAEIRQLPLRLAWAITVHKSQGMNLDAAEIDLSKSFVEGMGYVALSRLRSLEGLKLKGINQMAFMVNQEILELDKKLKEMSDATVKDLRNMPIWEKKKRQKQFLRQLPRHKKGKGYKEKESISTYEMTKSFVCQKLSIEEMAKCRGLSEETILSHLERLASSDKGLDLKHLQFSDDRFNKIKQAFFQTKDLKLSPVKEILGDDFSYKEIRLARLFLKD